MKTYSFADVCAELGIEGRRLQMAIYNGDLPHPDVPSRLRTLARYSQDWLDSARNALHSLPKASHYKRDVFTVVNVPAAARSVILRKDVFESALAAAARVRERAE